MCVGRSRSLFHHALLLSAFSLLVAQHVYCIFCIDNHTLLLPQFY